MPNLEFNRTACTSQPSRGLSNVPSFRRCLAVWFLLFAGTCSATPALMDLLEYEGELNIVTPRGRPWLELLENEKTQEIRRKERCSAIGAPRGKWRVSNGRLWLVGLFKCGGVINLETVYGGGGEPILAEWITADLMTQRGKRLCRERYGGPGVQETTILIKVDRGVVTDIAQVSNQNHPAIPTVEKLRKLFGPKDAHLAEEEVLDWPCLDAYTQQQLQGESSVQTPTGSTYWEFLNDHGRRLLRP